MSPDLCCMHSAAPMEDDEDGTALDTSHAILLARTFLAGPMHSDEATLTGDLPPLDRETAGCTLWDLSGSEPVARLLVRRCRLVEVLEAVLARELMRPQQQEEEKAEYGQDGSGGGVDTGAGRSQEAGRDGSGGGGCMNLDAGVGLNARIVEICLGILANLCAHEGLRPLSGGGGGGRDGEHDNGGSRDGPNTLPRLLVASLPLLLDPACLSELFRLMSVALRREVSGASGGR